MNRETCVIIPVYNEAPVIRQTVEDVLKHFPLVVCINDGSKDNTSSEILKTEAILIEHSVNLGQGAALQTGIDYGLQRAATKYFVTFDADGQHDINDVQAMLGALKDQELDIVIGSRFLGKTIDMPWLKRMVLKMATSFTNLTSDMKLTDTHNGLRVFSRRVAGELNISMSGMAHASEIVYKISHSDWSYSEFPVTIRYSKYSRSKGQSILNSINIFIDLLISKTAK